MRSRPATARDFSTSGAERKRPRPLRYVPVIPLGGFLIQGLGCVLNRFDPTKEWTFMYSVVARRK